MFVENFTLPCQKTVYIYITGISMFEEIIIWITIILFIIYLIFIFKNNKQVGLLTIIVYLLSLLFIFKYIHFLRTGEDVILGLFIFGLLSIRFLPLGGSNAEN